MHKEEREMIVKISLVVFSLFVVHAHNSNDGHDLVKTMDGLKNEHMMHKTAVAALQTKVEELRKHMANLTASNAHLVQVMKKTLDKFRRGHNIDYCDGASWRRIGLMCISLVDCGKRCNPRQGQSVCQGHGGMLARIYNEGNGETIRRYLSESYKDYDFIYIDGSDEKDEGHWTFSDGSTMQFLPWSQDQPNGGTKANCLRMGTTKLDYYDYECDLTSTYYKGVFACEKF